MTTAIICALERELLPLVRSWKTAPFTHNGHTFMAYEGPDTVVVAGGIGCPAATRAAQAMIARYQPQTLISAGLAGALIPSLKVGNIIVPNVIICGADGAEYRCDLGGGILLTGASVADAASKSKLVSRFHALAVAMEAAAVAEVARAAETGFRCVKSISDEAGFPMPPLDRFIDSDGQFHTARFIGWSVLRPHLWPRLMALGRNTAKAAESLCGWLRQHLESGLQPSKVVRLDRAELLETH